MPLTAHDITVLNSRARDVGSRIGWELHYEADFEKEFAGLTAGTERLFVTGPTALADIARTDIESILDELILGTLRIVDHDGHPRLV